MLAPDHLLQPPIKPGCRRDDDEPGLEQEAHLPLRDRAVLNEHAAVTAKISLGQPAGLDVLIDFDRNDMAEQRLEKNFIEKGEAMEWLIEDRDTFILRRLKPQKPVLKKGETP